jgi:predicted amidohydrolase
MDLTLHIHTWDIGQAFASPAAVCQEIIRLTRESWLEGADVVLFPEYCWLSLEPFCPPDADKLESVARMFWQECWPNLLLQNLVESDKCVVLGTVPWKSSGEAKLRNRAPIVSDGKAHFQDKLCLTPWEFRFEGGEAIHTWELRGFRLGTLICLDIEIPEHAVALRKAGLDFLLVPSATETILGVERITRCASARSIELGCAVAVSHLIGRSDSVLADENIGRTSFFLPSQSPFANAPRETIGEIHDTGSKVLKTTLSRHSLAVMRRNWQETNPALLAPKVPEVS